MLEQSIPEGLYAWKGPMLEQFLENFIPWEGPHADAGEEYKEDGEGATEAICYGVTKTLIPHPHVLL